MDNIFNFFFDSLIGTYILIFCIIPILFTFTHIGLTCTSFMPWKTRYLQSILFGMILLIFSCGFYMYLGYRESWYHSDSWADFENWFLYNYEFLCVAILLLLVLMTVFCRQIWRKNQGHSLSSSTFIQICAQRFCAFAQSGSLILLGFLYMKFHIANLPNYTQPYTTLDDLQIHSPISGLYELWFELPLLLGAIALTYLRRLRPFSPLPAVFLVLAVLFGAACSALFLFQLSSLLFSLQDIGRHTNDSGSFQANFSYTFFLALYPLYYWSETIALLRRLWTNKIPVSSSTAYYSPWLKQAEKRLSSSRNWPGAALLAALPLIIFAWLLLQLWGHSMDIWLKPFTDTADWRLSEKIAPPTIDYEGHYLCTVAAQGHSAIVKPLRFGIRHGQKIIVNRQLLIANAFEDLLAEKLPHLHKIIRRNYDQYGYPLSKHIHTSWSADLVYLLMKPAEWLFLAALYLLDHAPEERISRQYHI